MRGKRPDPEGRRDRQRQPGQQKLRSEGGGRQGDDRGRSPAARRAGRDGYVGRFGPGCFSRPTCLRCFGLGAGRVRGWQLAAPRDRRGHTLLHGATSPTDVVAAVTPLSLKRSNRNSLRVCVALVHSLTRMGVGVLRAVCAACARRRRLSGEPGPAHAGRAPPVEPPSRPCAASREGCDPSAAPGALPRHPRLDVRHRVGTAHDEAGDAVRLVRAPS